MKDMSTKPQNIDTSEKRVQAIDKSIHDDDDIQEYKRPWVGLTDEEIYELRQKTFDGFATNHEVYRAIEAALRSKNT